MLSFEELAAAEAAGTAHRKFWMSSARGTTSRCSGRCRTPICEPNNPRNPDPRNRGSSTDPAPTRTSRRKPDSCSSSQRPWRYLRLAHLADISEPVVQLPGRTPCPHDPRHPRRRGCGGLEACVRRSARDPLPAVLAECPQAGRLANTTLAELLDYRISRLNHYRRRSQTPYSSRAVSMMASKSRSSPL
jgi:hypothetical protein